MTTETFHNLFAEALRIARRCCGVALLAMPLVIQTPAVFAAQAKKPAAKVAHAKHAVKKGKSVAVKAGKASKIAKANKATRGTAVKLAHGKKPGAVKHAKANLKRTQMAQRKGATATAKLVAEPAAINAPVVAAKPATARPERTAALPSGLVAETTHALPQPDFKVATAACQRDGKIYLLSSCDSNELPDVKTASLTRVGFR